MRGTVTGAAASAASAKAKLQTYLMKTIVRCYVLLSVSKIFQGPKRHRNRSKGMKDKEEHPALPLPDVNDDNSSEAASRGDLKLGGRSCHLCYKMEETYVHQIYELRNLSIELLSCARNSPT